MKSAVASKSRFASSSLLMRNATLSLLTEGWGLVVLIVATPKLVFSLGETRFGLFSLAWIMIGYLAFLDIGVNRAATKFVSEHLARNDSESTHRVVRTAVIANVALGVLGGFIFAVLSRYLVKVFNVSPELESEARLSFYAVSVAIPVLLAQGVLRAVLSSLQRFGWINAVNGLATTVQWALACVLAWRGYGVATIVWATVLVRLVAVLAYSALLLRELAIHQSVGGWIGTTARLLKLLQFGTWVTVSQVISPLVVYLDRILIASMVSLGAVTLYTVPYEMMTRLRVIPSSLAGTLYPAFSERGTTESRAPLQRLYEGALRYILIVLLPGILFLLVLGPDILRVWMGARFAQETTWVIQILAIGALANAIAYVPYNLLQAVGRPDLTAKVHLLELPLYFVLCLVLIPRGGITGAALASTIRFTLDAGLLFFLVGKCCQFSIWSSIIALRRTLALAFVQAMALLLIKGALSTPWARLGTALLTVLFSLLVAWIFIVDKQEKPRISGALRMLLGQQAS